VGIVRLPVAGVDVLVQLPTGAEDILLREAGVLDFAVALALLSRLVHRADGDAIDWETLAITDVDVLLLRLRQRVLGDAVTAEVLCPAPGCNARVDIAFSIGGYIDHHRPHTPPRLLPAEEQGWFRLDGGEIEFRVPRAADQIAIAVDPRPEQALLLRCVRPAAIPARTRRRVETAMEAMAPSLFSELHGICPECGEPVTCSFDPLQYSLRELREQAAFVYEDVSTIAGHAHWSEADILALPTARRTRYAELAQQERVTA
jgi:hypothetical protein